MWTKWCLACYEPGRRSNRQDVSRPMPKTANSSCSGVVEDKVVNSTQIGENKCPSNATCGVKAVNEKLVQETSKSSTPAKKILQLEPDRSGFSETTYRPPPKKTVDRVDSHPPPASVHSTTSGSSRPIWTLQDVLDSPVKSCANSVPAKKLTFLPVTEDSIMERPEVHIGLERPGDQAGHPSHQQPFFLPRIHTDPNASQAGQHIDLPGMPQSKSFPIRRGSMIVRGGRTTATAVTSGAVPDSLPPSAGMEGVIVTPFAQVLVSMQRIRNAFIRLTFAQSSNRFGVISSAVPEPSLADFIGRDTDEYKSIANETLEELEWCLKQLENIQTKRPVSDMTFSKFKRLLNRELNSFGESDKSRNEISAYICKTFLEDEKDAEANQEIEQMLEQRRSSGQSHGSSTGAGQEPVSSPTAIASRAGHQILENTTGNTVVKFVDGTDHNTTFKSSSNQLDSGKMQPLRTEPGDAVDGSLNRTETSTSQPLPKHGIETPYEAELEEQFTNYIDKWGADIFEIDRISQGHALTTTAYRIFKNRGLLQTFSIDPATFLRYLLRLETNYHPDVSYHNALHAADVLQTSHYLLQAETLEDVFSELEIFAVLFASVIHDVNHPGLTNQYLINTGHDLALQYNDLSVLENHHLYVGFKILNEPGCDILEGWAGKKRQTFRRMVIELVLATDMSKHMSLLADLRTMVETKKVSGSGVLNLDNYADRIQILQNMIHCADLSNSAKPLALNRKWTSRLMEEFFRQGDRERSLKLEISPMCDRESVAIESSQVSFIDFVAHPLLESWCDLVHPAAQEILDILEDNRNWYQSQSETRKSMMGSSKNRPRLATAEEDDEEEAGP